MRFITRAAAAGALVTGVALGAHTAAPTAQASTAAPTAQASTAAPTAQASTAAPTLSLVWEQPIADGGAGSYVDSSSPNLADLTGGPSVVVGDSSGHVYAYHLATGSSVPGWPKTVSAAVTSTPSVVDTTPGTTVDTILVGTGNFSDGCTGGYQWLYPNGSQQLVKATNPVYDTQCAANGVQASMAVGTLQGQTTTVAGSLGQMTYAMNAASRAVLSGFPWFQGDTEYASPAIGHVEGTGANQIVEGGASTAGIAYGKTYTDGGHIRILTASGGLVCEDTTDEAIDSSPAVGPFLASGATGIVAGTAPTYPSASQRDDVIAVNSSCQQVWSKKLTGTTGFSSPALADVLGNGQLQVIAATKTGGVYALAGATGAVLWSTKLRFGILGSPVTMALGTGHQDVLVASDLGLDILTGTDGALLVKTFETTTSFENAPLVTHDANGTIGITIAGHESSGSGSVVAHYEVRTSSGADVDGTDTWPEFHHDPQLTGDVTTPIVVPVAPFATYTRIDGETADATAAAELEHQFPYAAGTCPGTTATRPVVLATDATYPDALASSYLARSLDTGTLLTPTRSLSSATLTAIHKEGITEVYVVGGSFAVSTAVVSTLQSTAADECGGAPGSGTRRITVRRIAGTTEYTTAEKIAEAQSSSEVGSASFAGAYSGTTSAGGNGRYNDSDGGASSAAPASVALPTAIVATGTMYQDAESASTMSYAERFPVLLTTPTALSPQVSSAIGNLGIKQVIVMGGSYAVSDSVASALEQLGVSVLRIAGETASATSVELAQFETTAAPDGLGWAGTGSVTVASGSGFTDGMAGAVVAADGPTVTSPEPLVLTPGPTSVGTPLANFLQSAGTAGIGGETVTHLVVLGGALAITQSTVDEMGADL